MTEKSVPKRIIIFRQGQFGDTLVAFPVIQAIHELYPKVPLVYLTNNFKSKKFVQAKDVIGLNPFIQRTITYTVEDSPIKKWLGVKEKLKAKKGDWLIYLPYSKVKRFQIIRDWLFFKSLNFKNLFGFKQNWDWVSVYTKSLLLPKESERLFNIVHSSGMAIVFPKKFALDFAKDWAEKQLKKWGINEKKILVICPGSKMQCKRWPIERYIEVGKKWHKRSGAMLIIVGGIEESEIADELVNAWNGYGFSICGATIRQTASLLSKAQAYCGNDTGSMHLAALLGVPCVALFSMRSPPKLWFPLGKQHVVLSCKVPCANCMLETCHSSPSVCLNKVSVNMVIKALKRVWKNN